MNINVSTTTNRKTDNGTRTRRGSRVVLATGKPDVREREIEITNEYDVFERIPGNRPVTPEHVQALVNAMRVEDLFTPIQINENFEIIDGQHRLEARRILGLDVPYYVTSGYGLAQVQALNAKQKKWTNDDFVSSYIELGKSDYEIYRWFRIQYQLPHKATLALLAPDIPTKTQREIFQGGRFRVTDLDGAKRTGKKLADIEPYFDHWNDTGFVAAMLTALRKKNFNLKTFMMRLASNPTWLKPQATIDLYLQHIEDVYNYRSPNKVAIRYGEDR